MIAFQTLVMTYKIVKTKKPTYLSNKLKENTNQRVLRGGSQSLIHPNQSLSISKKGFIKRSLTPMNMLNNSLRCELVNFKLGVREWVKSNIQIKPVPKFPVLGGGGARPPAPPAPPAQGLPATQARNLITNYFQRQNIA